MGLIACYYVVEDNIIDKTIHLNFDYESYLENNFTEDELVQKHFNNPGESWDAAMVPTDGGITRILTGINSLSNPEFRANNLRNKAIDIADKLLSKLDQYFNKG